MAYSQGNTNLVTTPTDEEAKRSRSYQNLGEAGIY